MTIRKERSFVRLFARFGGLFAGCFLFAQSALAVPFGNPFPGIWNDDIDGTGLFNAPLSSIFTENLDVFDGVGEFGFFEASTPTTLVPIFEAADVVGDSALVDFANGFIFDIDEGVGQNVFAPVTGPIGFYLTIPGATVFSVPELNVAVGGLDGFGAYENIPNDDFNLLFAVPGSQPGLDQLLSWSVATGLTPFEEANNVPAPLPLALLGLGVVMLGARSRRRSA